MGFMITCGIASHLNDYFGYPTRYAIGAGFIGDLGDLRAINGCILYRRMAL